jgi:DNA-binding NarL/FixJ family response regulator
MQILLADSHVKERTALRRLLEQDPELSVVGEAAEAKDLLTQVRLLHPDLVLFDWGLPGLEVSDLLSALYAVWCPVKVVAFGQHGEARQRAMAAGVDAFVSREDPVEWLLATLHAVAGLSPAFVE